MPMASWRGWPGSATSDAGSWSASRMARASRRNACPRPRGPSASQAVCACRARSTAAATSPGPVTGTSASSAPVAGAMTRRGVRTAEDPGAETVTRLVVRHFQLPGLFRALALPGRSGSGALSRGHPSLVRGEVLFERVRIVSPETSHRRGQGRPGRARPWRQDRRPGAGGRWTRGHLHGTAPDPRDDRCDGGAGVRGRRGPVGDVWGPHDAVPRRDGGAGGARGSRRRGIRARHRAPCRSRRAEAAGRRRDLPPGRVDLGDRPMDRPGTAPTRGRSRRLSGMTFRNWFGMTTAGLLAAGVAMLALPARSLAFANTETEEEFISRALQSALEKHGGDVNRCFEKALADRLDVAGKVELSVDVGDEGKVTRAVAVDHDATTPVLLACLEASTATWVIPGVAPGTTVILPLAFEGQAAQFSIKTADAPEHGPGAGGKGKAKAKGPTPAFTVKVLVDEATMRARQASLSLLTIEPANRIAMHKHPGAELLYIRKGRARVLG